MLLQQSLVPLILIPTDRVAPLANTAIENPPVIIVDVIRTVSITLVIVLNCFIFLATFNELQSHQAKMPKFQLIFSSNLFVDLAVL